ncbi:MAG: four helix bundle protein [Candidatus Harrisonbacteria bacterium]|nr:four helix bundle protein [Candidatus Harrisonbacteria bacterium]
MDQSPNTKKYDLEERTFNFAKRVNGYVNSLPKIITNIENGKQLVRSSGSVAANYIEANEALSKKDFVIRIKICRKESKESCLWLKLSAPKTESESEREYLIKESGELTKIFGSIVEGSK